MKALVVAGTHSGVGKTSIAVGLMTAFVKRGLRVQPFKVGPDFIDPSHHCRATGRTSRNLDGWMLSRQWNQRIFAKSAIDVDVAIVEGVMGLFDGYDGKSESGSTAEIAKWLDAPILLIVDAWAMSRSAAALIRGFETFDPKLKFAGVLFNRVAGPSHLTWIREAVEPHCKIRVLGGVPKDPGIMIPERHLGLWMSHEARLPQKYISRLGELVEKNVNLDALLKSIKGKAAGRSPGTQAMATPLGAREHALRIPLENRRHSLVRIGVARDEAFCFYYQDNLDLLEDFGAKLVPFSPLREKLPAELDLIYLGGGYPELHAKKLASNKVLLEALRCFAHAGGKIYGECGGLMYLSRGIIDPEGKRYPLCGIFPFWTRMTSRVKLAYTDVKTTLGCRLFSAHKKIRGHFFHFSEIEGKPRCQTGYRVKTYGSPSAREGFRVKNVLASYIHLHFGSNPEFARSLARKAGL